MTYRFTQKSIKEMLQNQIKNNYFLSSTDVELIEKYFPKVMEKLQYNFSHSTNKYYSCTLPDGTVDTYFDPLHSCQWLIFLYTLANTVHNAGEDPKAARELCDKVYGLSKIVSGADLYYEIKLPDIFFCDHPTGSVMGRAVYGDYFSFGQGCTVGNNKGVFPVIGTHVVMHSDAKILGNSKIGNNVIVAANAYIKDQDVPDNVIVFGQSPNLIFKPYK